MRAQVETHYQVIVQRFDGELEFWTMKDITGKINCLSTKTIHNFVVQVSAVGPEVANLSNYLRRAFESGESGVKPRVYIII